MITLKYTAEQKAIFEILSNENSGNICIDAKAGAAKTTVLEHGASLVPEKVGLALAFNKSIAEVLAEKLPNHIIASTFHKFGFATWRQKLSTKHNINSFKLFELQKELWGDEYDKEVLADIRDLCNAARLRGLVPENSPPYAFGLMADSKEHWIQLADSIGILSPARIVPLARTLTKVSIKQSMKGIIDFVDMLYMPIITKAKFAQYPIVFIDEAQDLSPLQHVILKKAIKKGGRCVFVGDPHQSIYGFAGAKTNSMKVLELELDATSYPLNTSFRCASSIIAEAQTFVPEIEAWSESPAGSVTHLTSWDLDLLEPTDIVLCRNNAPLMSLASTLISKGKLCQIQGRDIGKGLIKLVEKECQGAPIKSSVLEMRVSRWIRAQKESGAQFLQAKIDKAKCILILCQNCQTSTEVLAQIDSIFITKNRYALQLSSIHRAKGLEWNKVFILDSHLMPSEYAKTPEQVQQEDNLFYVAITRAKNELVYIQSSNCTTQLFTGKKK